MEAVGATQEALSALYEARYGVFERIATTILSDPEEARDAVQDGFATALRRRRSFRAEGPLEAWVWRIVLNAAYSAARKRSETPIGLHLELNGAAHDQDHAGLAVWLGRLSERQRMMIFLHYVADLEYAVIAEALDVASGTVAATLNQARQVLRAAIEEEGT